MNGNNKRWLKPALLAVVLASAGSIAIAQAHSRDWGYGGHERCERGEGGHGFMSRQSRFEPGRHIEGILAYVKAELKITADQEQAWNKFADVVRDNAKARAAARQARATGRQASPDGKVAPLTERIDSRLDAMEERTDMFKKMAEAAKTLYAQLTPEQQGIADHMLPPRQDHEFRHPGLRSRF